MYWLPQGARGRWLLFGGEVYEAVAALLDRREQLDIYHSVLEVHAIKGRVVIEMGRAIDDDWASRGVVVQGPIGSSWAAALRILLRVVISIAPCPAGVMMRIHPRRVRVYGSRGVLTRRLPA